MKRLLSVISALSLMTVYSCSDDTGPIVNITDFGAVGDGITDNTEAINSAIAAAPEGAAVIVPAGRFLSGTIHLKSHMTFRLEDGSEITGTGNLDGYDCYHPSRDMSRYDSGVGTRNANVASDARWTRALIIGQNLEDVAITGKGTINGMHVRDSLGEESMRGPHAILLAECSNVRLSGFSVRCASNYAILGYELTASVMDRLDIREGWDGIHVRGCRDLIIKDCDIQSGDDAIAGGYWENIEIRDCSLNSSCNGIRMIEPGKNVLINGCRIYGPGIFPHRSSSAERGHSSIYAIVLEPGGWGPAPGRTENVIIRNCTVENMLSVIVYSMGEDNSCSGLTIENVNAYGITYNTTPLNRQECPRMWDNISIRNYNITSCPKDNIKQ